MSIHIGAKPGEIASTVLLPGDPLRAKFIAETLLEEAVCFNQVRGMLGYTGQYQGQRVSVMGTGMGIPSLSIYVTELVRDYGARRLIRVGTCGALQPDLQIGDLVLALTASTDSQINRLRLFGMDFAPPANFALLRRADEVARARGLNARAGGVLSSDSFYIDNPDWWKPWAAYGTLAVDMETNGLYSLAARFRVEALSIMTVSDSLVTGAAATSEQRERSFPHMAQVALALAEKPGGQLWKTA